MDLLRFNSEFAADVAFLARRTDDAEGLLSLMERIDLSSPESLRRWPGLCAAIVVVYDDAVRLLGGLPPEARGRRPLEL